MYLPLDDFRDAGHLVVAEDDGEGLLATLVDLLDLRDALGGLDAHVRVAVGAEVAQVEVHQVRQVGGRVHVAVDGLDLLVLGQLLQATLPEQRPVLGGRVGVLLAPVVGVGALQVSCVHVELPAFLVRASPDVHLHDGPGVAFALAGNVGEVLALRLVPVIDGVLDVVEAVRKDGPAVDGLRVRPVLALPDLEAEGVGQVVIAEPVAELLGLFDLVELVAQLVAGGRDGHAGADAVDRSQNDLGDLAVGVARVDDETLDQLPADVLRRSGEVDGQVQHPVVQQLLGKIALAVGRPGALGVSCEVDLADDAQLLPVVPVEVAAGVHQLEKLGGSVQLEQAGGIIAPVPDERIEHADDAQRVEVLVEDDQVHALHPQILRSVEQIDVQVGVVAVCIVLQIVVAHGQFEGLAPAVHVLVVVDAVQSDDLMPVVGVDEQHVAGLHRDIHAHELARAGVGDLRVDHGAPGSDELDLDARRDVSVVAQHHLFVQRSISGGITAQEQAASLCRVVQLARVHTLAQRDPGEREQRRDVRHVLAEVVYVEHIRVGADQIHQDLQPAVHVPICCESPAFQLVLDVAADAHVGDERLAGVLRVEKLDNFGPVFRVVPVASEAGLDVDGPRLDLFAIDGRPVHQGVVRCADLDLGRLQAGHLCDVDVLAWSHLQGLAVAGQLDG